MPISYMTSIVILILYPVILCPLRNSFQVKGPRSQDRIVSQRTRFQGMASTRVACAIFFSLKNVASSLSLLCFPLSLVTSAAVSVLYLTTKVIMDSSRERSRSPANLVLWRWCWKTSDSGSWYWEWFPVTYSWLRQKASISSSENLSSTPATTNQDASPTCSEASPSRKRKRSRTP